MVSARRVRRRWMAILTGCILSHAAFGIVLHPGDGEPDSERQIEKPAVAVMGRWANNGTCVVISANCVITTRHQGGGIGSVVHVGGTPYRVEAGWDHPGKVNPDDPDHQEVDLRIARLCGANLRDYATLYTGRREIDRGRSTVIGGYGRGRGAELKKDGITFGYAWEEPTVNQNLKLRWCTNTIDAVCSDVKSSNQSSGARYNHDLVIADFDDPGTTAAEGAVAGYDSGGGWFVPVDGGWQLAGVTWGSDRAQSMEIRFRSSSNPLVASPDRMYALRVSAYAEWIASVLALAYTPLAKGDLNSDDSTDMRDLAVMAAHWLRGDCAESNGFCEGADITGDGFVDAADLSLLNTHWIEDD